MRVCRATLFFLAVLAAAHAGCLLSPQPDPPGMRDGDGRDDDEDTFPLDPRRCADVDADGATDSLENFGFDACADEALSLQAGLAGAADDPEEAEGFFDAELKHLLVKLVFPGEDDDVSVVAKGQAGEVLRLVRVEDVCCLGKAVAVGILDQVINGDDVKIQRCRRVNEGCADVTASEDDERRLGDHRLDEESHLAAATHVEITAELVGYGFRLA